MYLRIVDRPYALNDALEVVESTSDESIRIIVERYVCLFDDNFNIIPEVWEYLHNRLWYKALAFNSVISKGNDLKLFYEFLYQYRYSYQSLSQKQINAFIAWLNSEEASPRSAKTINRILSTLKDFYTYHEAIHAISNPFLHASETIHAKKSYANRLKPFTPAIRYKIKEFDRGIRILSKDQIEVILGACTLQRDRLLFELLLFTGMRIGEALSLSVHSIGISDLRANVQDLTMHPNQDDPYKGNRTRQQKSGIRDLFIPTLLMEKLNEYYELTWLRIYEKKQMEHEFLFISEFHNNLGEPLSYQAVWERCRVIGKKTGIYFTPHDFRHTYATMLSRNQMSIDKLRKLLGHRYMASTDIYIQIASKEEMVHELVGFYESYGI
ncbi:MAG: tyrosine-type recombinase/integrase [Sulfuricurvum sp.]|nr:tyrosine-type recombinase/integrase [Sulfuricurvum sp.]